MPHRRPARRAAAPAPSARPVEVEIVPVRLGGGGDGVATLPDGRVVHVPFAAPGDRVRARLGPIRGNAVEASFAELVTAGPERQEPPCPHFGACGGCRVQHLVPETYVAWKRGLLATALDRAGVAGPIAPLAVIPPGTRRRATFAARRTGAGVVLGFNEWRSTRIVDVTDCRILDPRLAALLPPLRAMLGRLLPPGGAADIAAALLDDGADLVIESAAAPDLAARELLGRFAESEDLARLSWRGARGAAEAIAHRRPGLVRFGGVPVTPPPGGFLQASRAGEAALIAAVTDAVGAARRAADLFAGAGTFALSLAADPARRVLAVDGDSEAMGAVARAAGLAGIGGRVATAARDLSRMPLSTAELDAFEAVIFDPPRAGARAQAEALAASAVPIVVAVSCNPGTLARDARILVDGGYRMERAVPVDQFLWSAHLEAVGIFRRVTPHSSRG
jgi:23S rRNA (uracil1939-C5)-methyltransferase